MLCRKLINDLRQVGGFLRVLRFPPAINKTDRHDIAEILLKVALNNITIKPFSIAQLDIKSEIKGSGKGAVLC